MRLPSLPLILLAGGSSRYDHLPQDAESQRPLSGYKAADLRLDGSPLIEHVCARYAATGRFHPIYVAGPDRIYRGMSLSGAAILDTDGDFGQNLRQATERVVREHPGSAAAYATADVLPSPEDLKTALDDYDRHVPCAFWMLECRVPEERGTLGSSTWKPKYWIRGDEDPQPVPTLPGHLVIAKPEGVRRHLLYEIFEIAYRTRNTSIGYRFRVVTLGVFGSMLRADRRRLRSFQPPTLTLELLWNGTRFALHLRKGIDHELMARLLRRIYLTRSYRKAHPDEPGRVAVLDVLSLARDVDTRAEARELGLDLEPAKGPNAP